MFCYIKYAEHQDIERQDEIFSSKRGLSIKSVPSKISLTENKMVLVNPKCYIQILIDYVAEHINFNQSNGVNLDFCSSNGELLKVHELKPWEYATKLMQNQKVYIAVKCGENGHYKSIEPLLYKNSKEYFDVVTRLRRYLPGSRKFGSKTRRNSDDTLRTVSRNSRASDDNIRSFSKISGRPLYSA